MNNRWDYELSELLPVVQKLVEGYTSKESTSVTYETAQRLMEAVEYCIYENKLFEQENYHHWNKTTEMKDENNNLPEASIRARSTRLTAEEAYKRGYQIVLSKVREIRTGYNGLVDTFDAYENENYRSTVLDGIPGFLIYYDAKYHPQDQILTLDYPVLGHKEDECGVNLILSYVKKIEYEQEFLKKFPKNTVKEVLSMYHSDYQEMYFNIAAPFLRFVLTSMLLNRSIANSQITVEEYDRLTEMILSHSRTDFRAELRERLEKLCIKTFYGEDELEQEVFQYLKADIEDFESELWNAVNHECIEAVFHQC